MKHKEIEFKYNAADISMEKFIELAKNLKPFKQLLVSSHDDYFVDAKNNFIRYRHRDGWGELTIKRKMSDKNNNERIEVNIPTSGQNYEDTEAFVNLLGYKHNFGIFKTSQIYWIDNIVMAYYVVYNKQTLKEEQRFVEIEADESHPWESEEQAWAHVEKYEKLLEPLGISSRHRMRKSLFEIFAK